MTGTYALTDVGRIRDTNEDAVLTAPVGGGRLLLVADGVGGHAAGDIASDAAATTVRERLETADLDATDAEPALASAIEAANTELRARIRADDLLSKMGTTLVAALAADGEATIANVGDSRAYHIDDEVQQVTVDQSLVQKLVDSGEISLAEAETYPQRNVVSQALGTTESVDPDFYRVTVTGTLLLCSDGLTEEVPDGRIGEIVRSGDGLRSAADALVTEAIENGGSDNVSVVLHEP
jgi:protein phosphatase